MRVWRIHPQEQRVCTHQGVTRWVLVWMSVCFLVFTIGPPSRWRLKETQSSCPPCDCYCSSPEYHLYPLEKGSQLVSIYVLPMHLSRYSALVTIYSCRICKNVAEKLTSALDCGKHDPVMSEEMSKDLLTMLSEELNLQKIVANETLEHTKRLVMDARKTFSHYQKEAEKCNVGIETCEEARERAEAELVEERRLTALWEKRAREYGWSDRRTY